MKETPGTVITNTTRNVQNQLVDPSPSFLYSLKGLHTFIGRNAVMTISL